MIETTQTDALTAPPREAPATVLEVCNLTMRYGSTVAVNDVSFSVGHGEIFGILGPNGAGKTTTVECIAGLRRPDHGLIHVLGLEPIRDAVTLNEQVGVQLQASELPEKLRVGEALDLFGAFYREPADPARLLELLDLTDKRDERFGNLSGGQRQRLSIALALIGRPRLAILDELTTGLDPSARRDTWRLIEDVRAEGVTVLLVTHFMDEAERLCDRVAVFNHGELVALDRPAALAARYGGEQRLRFRPSAPVNEALLRDLPEVTSVTRGGDQLFVAGRGELLAAVTGALARAGISPHELRLDQASLEDAFVGLTH